MALTYGFYNSIDGDRKYDAKQLSDLFNGIINNGVFSAVGNALLVRASNGMGITVDTGRAWFNNTWTNNDAKVPLIVSASEVVLNRIDVVVLEINTTDGVRANSVKVLKGAPATSPVAPNLIRTDLVNQYPLAHIYVGANVSNITNANITNKVGTTDCPFVTGVMATLDVSALMTQWTTSYNNWYNGINAEADALLAQFNTEFNALFSGIDAQGDALIAQKNAEFTAWFDSLNIILSGDVATNLANRLLIVENDLNTQNVGSLSLVPTTPDVTLTDTESGVIDLEIGGATLNQIFIGGDVAEGWSTYGGTIEGDTTMIFVEDTGNTEHFAWRSFDNPIPIGRTIVSVDVKSDYGLASGYAMVINFKDDGSYDTFIGTPATDGRSEIDVNITTLRTPPLQYVRVYGRGGGYIGDPNKKTIFDNVKAFPVTGTQYAGYTVDQVVDMCKIYREGLISTESVSLLSRGLNLLSRFETGDIDATTGINIANPNRIRTADFIEVKPNTVYRISGLASYTWVFNFYDKNFNFIGYFVGSSPTTPPNCTYIRVRSGVDGENNAYLNWMLNEGSVALPYEPYEESKLTVKCENKMNFALSMLPNGIKNEINQVKGFPSAVKRINGEKVLNGSEGWYLDAVSTNTAMFLLQGFVADGMFYGDDVVNFLNDRFRQTLMWSSDVEGMFINGTNTIYIRINKSKLSEVTIAGFKNWLTANNVSFIYRLKQSEFIPYEQFEDYGIKCEGLLSSYGNYTNITYTGDLLPIINLQYSRNAAASIDGLTSGLSNAYEIITNHEERLDMLDEIYLTQGTQPNYLLPITTPTRRVTVKFHEGANVAVSIDAIPVMKPNGFPLTKVTAGAVMTVVRDGANFILQGEGASGNASASDLLSGKTADTDVGSIVGTMPLKTGVVQTFAANAGQWPDGGLAIYPEGGSYNWNAATEIKVPVTQLQIAEPDLVAANWPVTKILFGIQGSIPVRTGHTQATSVDATSTTTRIYMRPPAGLYNGDSDWVFYDDGAFLSQNWPVNVYLFGRQGTMPYGLNQPVAVRSQPNYVVYTPTNGFYNGQEIYSFSGDFVASNILKGKSPYGLAGTATKAETATVTNPPITGSLHLAGSTIPVYGSASYTTNGLTFTPSAIEVNVSLYGFSGGGTDKQLNGAGTVVPGMTLPQVQVNNYAGYAKITATLTPSTNGGTVNLSLEMDGVDGQAFYVDFAIQSIKFIA